MRPKRPIRRRKNNNKTYMEEIKKLRELTGAGMVDCKKALDEAGGDINQAVEILRKKGIAKSAKRGDRVTNEGVIKVLANNGQAYMAELNSETDFVARNEKFQEFGDQVLSLLAQGINNLDDLLAASIDNVSVKDALANLSGVIGEKLDIKRIASVSGASVAAYSHLGGKIGVVVALDQPGKENLAMDIAMQVAAANPKYLDSSQVDAAELEKEKEIYREQLAKEGKPEAILEKILEGKVAKYYSEVCLVDQEYIKDDKKKVKDVLGGVKILDFKRFSLV